MFVFMHNSSVVLAYRKVEVDNMADDIKELKDLERKLSVEDGDFDEKLSLIHISEPTRPY